MQRARITRFELQLLERLWQLGAASVREVQESLPAARRPAYTTVQTIILRLEEKRAIRRVKKIGNALIFEAVLTRTQAHRTLIRDVLETFGAPLPVILALLTSVKLSNEEFGTIRNALNRAEMGFLSDTTTLEDLTSSVMELELPKRRGRGSC